MGSRLQFYRRTRVRRFRVDARAQESECHVPTADPRFDLQQPVARYANCFDLNDWTALGRCGGLQRNADYFERVFMDTGVDLRSPRRDLVPE